MVVTSTPCVDIILDEIELEPVLSSAALAHMPKSDIGELINAAAADPDPANMFMRLYYLLNALGQNDFAETMQAKALDRQRVFRVVSPAEPLIRLLSIVAPGDIMDNSPLEYVVHDSGIRLDLLYIRPGQPLPAMIPDHDLAIVAISQSDKHSKLLTELDALVANWPRPVLNRPLRILRCARDVLSRLLQNIDTIYAPITSRLRRDELVEQRFPAVIRPVDSHAGAGLAKIDDQGALSVYLNAHPDPEFYLMDYIDYRSADDQFRKYRIALIQHKPYICHLAIADHWMVHYVSAGMESSAEKRHEEARVMQSFEYEFAVRHREALAAIGQILGLDYVVLDVGETRDGRLAVFEADTGAWIHATDSADVFPYKQAAMAKVFAAFRVMLEQSTNNPSY